MTLSTYEASIVNRAQLAEHLQEMGAAQCGRVLEAFATVPREAFVPAFYEDLGRSWRLCRSEDVEQANWLTMVYADQALVTKVGEHNLPVCSSSMPSLMARMLEALEVQPGQRVLEIGTGTGYNAALLAHMTGDPSLVVSVEIDEALVRQAEESLHQVAGAVKVVQADGVQDLPVGEHFDRVIVTAGSPGLPRLWYEELSEQGRMVLPLQGQLGAGGLLVCTKDTTTGSGWFEAVPLSFLALRSQTLEEKEPGARALFEQAISENVSVAGDSPVLAALEAQCFRWFLQWAWDPQGSLSVNMLSGPGGKRALLIKDARRRSILQLNREADGSWRGKGRGEVALWNEIMLHAERFEALERPGKQAFHVRIEHEQAALFVGSGQQEVFLRDLFS